MSSQKIEGFLGGVSQLPSWERLPSQAESSVNAFANIVKGLQKRPPTDHIAVLAADGTGYDDAWSYLIDKNATDRYRLTAVSGSIKVWDENGAEVTVHTPIGTSYLPTSNQNQNLRAVTVEDNTYLVNKATTVAKSSDATTARNPEALIHIQEGDYDTIYRIKVNSTTYLFQTPAGDVPEDRDQIDTVAIAAVLIEKMLALQSTFTITQYGPAIHLTRINGAEFTVQVEDGLSGFMSAVKGTAASALDLPKQAPTGFQVQIVGDEVSEWDDFYLQYDDSKTATGSGVWKEIVKPGSTTRLDPSTMPHVLEKGGNIMEQITCLTPLVDPDVQEDTAALIEDGFSTSQNAASPEDGSINVSIAASYVYSNLEDADTVETTYTAHYSVRCNTMAKDQTVVVRLWTNDGAGSSSWTERDSNVYVQSDGYVYGQTLSYTGVLGPDFDLRCDIIYFDDPGDGSQATVTFHGQSDAQPGVTFTPQASVDKLVEFTAATIYPEGSLVRITVNSTDCDYTPTTDVTGAAVAVALQPTIDAVANITATVDSAGVIRIADSGGTPTVVSSTGFDGQKILVADQDLGLTADTLVALVITNTTDGSTMTITGNGSRSITGTTALTGGFDNTFNAGDVCSVAGTGTYFVLREGVWDLRAAGDDVTNKFPSFVGNTITDIFLHRGRIGFLSGQSVTLTEAGNYANVFRSTVRQILDADRIDVTAAGDRAADFHAAQEWDGHLVLWSSKQQSVLTGEPLLTPKTVQLLRFTEFENSSAVRPVLSGSSMMFSQKMADAVRVAEYKQGINIQQLMANVDTKDGTFDISDLTLAVPRYILGNPLSMVGSPSHGLVFLLTDDDQSKLFVYHYHDLDGRRILSGWSEWQFGANDVILSVDILGNTMGLIVKRTEGIFLETMPLDRSYTDAGLTGVRLLDRRMDETVATPVYAASDTTWTLPFDMPAGDGTLQVVNKATGEVYTSDRPLDSTIRVQAQDLSSTNVYIGWKYTLTHELSDLYFRGQQGVVKTEGRTQLSYLRVRFIDTKDFKVAVLVTRVGGSAIDYAFTSSENWGEEGTLSVPIQSKPGEYTAQIINDTPNQCNISAGRVEGTYHDRSR